MQTTLRALARGVAVGAAFALAIGCTSGPAGSGTHARAGAKSFSARGPAPRKPDLAGIEREVLARVNRYRRSEGLPPLASDARIAEIARGHSRSMAAGRTGFGHGGFEGRTHALEGRIPYRRVAENVSRHVRDPRSVPEVAVEKWVDSRGHRRNIEGPFALTGVGAAAGPGGSVYLTQIFVLPR